MEAKRLPLWPGGAILLLALAGIVGVGAVLLCRPAAARQVHADSPLGALPSGSPLLGVPVGGATATPTPCLDNYEYSITSGSMTSGTSEVAGSECGSCVVPFEFPFPFTFYGQTYTTANLGAN